MSAGRASGALSRTRTPLEPEPEPEPEPNHRYRVGQVVRTGEPERREGVCVRQYRKGKGLRRPDSGPRRRDVDADSGAILVPAA